MLSRCVLRGREEERQKEQAVVLRTNGALRYFPEEIILPFASLVFKRGASHNNDLPRKDHLSILAWLNWCLSGAVGRLPGQAHLHLPSVPGGGQQGAQLSPSAPSREQH